MIGKQYSSHEIIGNFLQYDTNPSTHRFVLLFKALIIMEIEEVLKNWILLNRCDE
jgi:hypothetical protein